MSKTYASGLELQQKILSGVNKLADNVAATLGPKGRNVILAGKTGNPIVTKDGVTVANFVDLDDPVENTGAQFSNKLRQKQIVWLVMAQRHQQYWQEKYYRIVRSI